ncbi:MAG: thioesterase domain-containing protein [Cytophagales bacterium]|nr:thioesterase domain-containing protein [Cytophagales bacterium]
MNKLKLFCFPYAGGSAVIFKKWKQHLDPSIELRPIELAGRGKRIQEPLYNDIYEATDDIFHHIYEELIESPYAFFGHSMGAIIAHLLAHKINHTSLAEPMHLFFAGRGAPHVERQDEKKYHLMDNEDFKKEVINLGGTPPEFFNHPELLELFLPLLKNDFKIAETYEHQGEIQALSQNMTVFLGKEDDLTPEQCGEWEKHTTGTCSTHYFDGGHFFLHDETIAITDIINRTLIRMNDSKMALEDLNS